jgi:hypothetical protein
MEKLPHADSNFSAKSKNPLSRAGRFVIDTVCFVVKYPMDQKRELRRIQDSQAKK